MPEFYVTIQRTLITETAVLVRADDEQAARDGNGRELMILSDKVVQEDSAEIVGVLPFEEPK